MPMVQAHNWFDLVSDKEIAEFKQTGPSNKFLAEISLIAERGNGI